MRRAFSGEQIDGFRSIVAESYNRRPDTELAGMLSEVTGRMPEAEANFFTQALGSIGRAAVKLAPKALPLVGGLVGGPIGGVIGGAASQLFRGAGGTAPPPGQTPIATVGRAVVAPPAPLPAPSPPVPQEPASDDPVNQLMRAIQNPQVIQAIAALVAGSMGKEALPVGGKMVPVGAFPNLLESLAARAGVQAARMERESATPEYLLDAEGEPVGDIANPDERADILFRMLEGESTLDDDTDEFAAPGYEHEMVVEWVD